MRPATVEEIGQTAAGMPERYRLMVQLAAWCAIRFGEPTELRQTGATLAAQAAATTREPMDRLGHSTSAMAMRYPHVADDRPAEIARRLSLLAHQGDHSTPA